ncbi:SAM-dependent methyltransferase [Sphingomonas sp. G-3-2-10]|nr:SAM-dependent methyltransferase [Sphingomonas sp. G-3-2-10]
MYRSDTLRVAPKVPRAWDDFSRKLPHQTGERAKRNWGHAWHSLCSYQGKLKPAIANSLVVALLPSAGGRLLDPFSGVGTIPLEARLLGHRAFGFDISPAAIAISRAKLEEVDPALALAEIDALDRWIQTTRPGDDVHVAGSIRFNGPVETYFHHETFSEILAARSYFREHGFANAERSLVLGCLLHILHGNRPYALSRRSHPITPFAPTGAFERRALIPRLRTKVERVLEAGAIAATGSAIYDQDATSTWPSEVDSLDAIITSPPFFDSTRFYSANWMRLWFAGWTAEDFSIQPNRFVERRQKVDFSVYEPIFRQAAERLKPNGYLALHLGKSAKCDMADALIAIGRRQLRLVHVFSEDVGHCESHGIRDKGAVTDHQYVLFAR